MSMTSRRRTLTAISPHITLGPQARTGSKRSLRQLPECSWSPCATQYHPNDLAIGQSLLRYGGFPNQAFTPCHDRGRPPPAGAAGGPAANSATVFPTSPAPAAG